MEEPRKKRITCFFVVLPAHALRGRGSESFRVGQQKRLRKSGAFLPSACNGETNENKPIVEFIFIDFLKNLCYNESVKI